VHYKSPELNTLLAGCSEFGVEDLSVVGRMIVAPDVESMYSENKPWGLPDTSRVHDVFLRRLLVLHLRYEGRLGSISGPTRASVSGSSI
jgi:hypothetical protein